MKVEESEHSVIAAEGKREEYSVCKKEKGRGKNDEQ